MNLQISKDIALPINAITQKFAFLARTGAGKTYAATKLCELMVEAGAQIVALDPVGVWPGLRLAADGKGKGLPIPVFGGDYGDLPLEPEAGAFMARLIVEKQINAILDVSTFRKEKRKRFATDFAEELFHLKKSHRSPIHLFLEECQTFVPQKVFKGDERMLGAFEDVIRLGRNYGIGASMISQRPQSVNKDVLWQTECLFAFQTSGIQERKVIEEWISKKGIQDDIKEILPYLEIGDVHIWSPQWLKISATTRFLLKKTYDLSATPIFGTKIVQPKTLSPVDIETIKAEMSEVITRSEADDPKKLKSQIAQLKRDLEKAQKIVPQIAPKETVKEIPLVPVKEIEALTAEVAGFRSDYISKLERIAQGFEVLNGQNAINQIEQKVGKLLSAIPSVKALTVPVRAPLPKAVARVAAPRVATTEASGDLTKAERFVLRAFYWTRADRDISAPKIGFYSGYSHKSGGFSNTLSSLRTKGFLEGYKITDAGEDLAATYAEVRPSGLELREWLRPKLSKCENEILDVLVAYPGIRFDSETLAQQTVTQYSHTSGGWSNSLSRLRSLEAAEGYGREGVKAADVFFE